MKVFLEKDNRRYLIGECEITEHSGIGHCVPVAVAEDYYIEIFFKWCHYQKPDGTFEIGILSDTIEETRFLPGFVPISNKN